MRQIIETSIQSVDEDTILAQTLKCIRGQDFLLISDTNAHTSLDCYMIVTLADTVFNEIVVAGVNCVTAKGLAGITVPANSMLPFGKTHCTSIDLTSGMCLAYIN